MTDRVRNILLIKAEKYWVVGPYAPTWLTVEELVTGVKGLLT